MSSWSDAEVTALRAQFPQLARLIHGKPLVYFDNANTAQTPERVVAAMDRYYRDFNANVARAVHTLGSEATEHYEAARDVIAGFLNAQRREEIVFTSGTTAAINLVAYSFLAPKLQPGDEILVSQMEHHANIVPWQLIAERAGAKVVPVPINQAGELLLPELAALINPRTRLIGITHVSNALGTINPVAEIVALAKTAGVPVLVDGSQAVPHLAVDVQALDADFYVFTGHKLFGPTGTGVLYAKTAHLEAMPPFFGGGEMIRTVSFSGTTFADPPHRFEAGTPNIAGFIGLAEAVRFVQELGIDRIAARESMLCELALVRFQDIPGFRLIGQAKHRAPVFSFVIDGVHAHDVATLLDFEGVAVRSGHHCAHPLMQFYGVPATARASLAFYNTEAEITQFVAAVKKVRERLL
ncbi:cysteine desulfurase CsdA [Ahniella affigens]|uniref:Probable cysteine desulfurase n=1 Tax=Ahniella affigens TaxID=2021234 RepID=A0A2P1PWN0_9GAMM|nr:cysteine desulfurase [Ahniella affigens]AVP99184.1 cysteine desulfurase CsdA [Ahniella affigens]